MKVNSVSSSLASSPALREFVDEAITARRMPGGRFEADRLEISDAAAFLSRLARLPDVRVEKIAAVRTAIQEGRYETPEKLNQAIEKLLGEL